MRDYGDLIEKVINNTFEKLPLTDDLKEKLLFLSYAIFLKKPPKGYKYILSSGIVICGYGRKDIFPKICVFELEGLASKILTIAETNKEEISYENDAIIYPFAQRNVVANFIEGIDPSYKKMLLKDIEYIFDEYPKIILEIVKSYIDEKKFHEVLNNLQHVSQEKYLKYFQKIRQYEYENFIAPIIKIVRSLPKAELASLAETLIHLTSLKRKFSPDVETVGGPVDVLVLSKGDGLIWIKRKHYFEKDLNYRFFANYFKEEKEEEVVTNGQDKTNEQD